MPGRLDYVKKTTNLLKLKKKKLNQSRLKLFTTNTIHQNLLYINTEYQNIKGYFTMKKQLTNEHTEKCPTSLVLKEITIKQ